MDHIPVVKFFNPFGAGVWLATELDQGGDMVMPGAYAASLGRIKAAGGKVQGFGVSAHVLQAIHNHQVDNYRDAQIMDDYTNDLIV